jgi:hypothetical protein
LASPRSAFFNYTFFSAFFVFIKPNKLIKAAFNKNITLYSNRTLGVKMSNEDTRPLSGALTAIRQSGPD